MSTHYIIHDNEGVMFGHGGTAEAAWKNAVKTLADRDVTLVDDDADLTKITGRIKSRIDMTASPASDDLVKQIKDGDMAHLIVDGVAVTFAEATEAAAAAEVAKEA